jgi:hypothetical protein
MDVLGLGAALGEGFVKINPQGRGIENKPEFRETGERVLSFAIVAPNASATPVEA